MPSGWTLSAFADHEEWLFRFSILEKTIFPPKTDGHRKAKCRLGPSIDLNSLKEFKYLHPQSTTKSLVIKITDSDYLLGLPSARSRQMKL